MSARTHTHSNLYKRDAQPTITRAFFLISDSYGSIVVVNKRSYVFTRRPRARNELITIIIVIFLRAISHVYVYYARTHILCRYTGRKYSCCNVSYYIVRALTHPHVRVHTRTRLHLTPAYTRVMWARVCVWYVVTAVNRTDVCIRIYGLKTSVMSSPRISYTYFILTDILCFVIILLLDFVVHQKLNKYATHPN